MTDIRELEQTLARARSEYEIYVRYADNYSHRVRVVGEQIRDISEQIRRAKAYVEDLSKFSTGTVIRWDEPGYVVGKGQQDLTFAAVKADDRWYVTRSRGQILTSSELREHLNRKGVHEVELLSSHRYIKRPHGTRPATGGFNSNADNG